MPLTERFRAWLGNAAANRRTFLRSPVLAQATFWVDGHSVACAVLDVSPGGAFVQLTDNAPFPLQDGLTGQLEMPYANIKADVQLVRHTDDGWGLRFLQDHVGAILTGLAKADDCNESQASQS